MNAAKMFTILAAIAVGSLAVGCGGSDSSTAGDDATGVTESTIRLGTSFPTSGPLEAPCKPYGDGAAAWFDRVNQQGGVQGRTIDNVILDDAYKAPEALANGREFSRGDYFAIFHGCGTIPLPVIQPIAEQNGVPYLFPFAATPELSQPPVEDNFFAIFPSFNQQLPGLVRAAFERQGPGRVYVMHVRVPGSEQTIESIEEATQANGGTFVGEEVHTTETSDFTPGVLRMKAARPDYLVCACATTTAVRIFQAMADQDTFPAKKVLGTTSLSNNDFLRPVRDLAEDRLLAASIALPPSSDEARTCVEAFRAASPPVEPSIGSLWGCGAAQAMVTALDDAGPDLTREGLYSALEQWREKQVSEVLPPISFTDSDHTGAQDMFIVEAQDGDWAKTGTFGIE